MGPKDSYEQIEFKSPENRMCTVRYCENDSYRKWRIWAIFWTFILIRFNSISSVSNKQMAHGEQNGLQKHEEKRHSVALQIENRYFAFALIG